MKVIAVTDYVSDRKDWSSRLEKVGISPIFVPQDVDPSPTSIKELSDEIIQLGLEDGSVLILDVNLNRWDLKDKNSEFGGFKLFGCLGQPLIEEERQIRCFFISFFLEREYTREQLHGILKGYCPERLRKQVDEYEERDLIDYAETIHKILHKLLPINPQKIYSKILAPIFYLLYLPIDYFLCSAESVKGREGEIQDFRLLFDGSQKALESALGEARGYLQEIDPFVRSAAEEEDDSAILEDFESLQDFFESEKSTLNQCFAILANSRSDVAVGVVDLMNQFISDFCDFKEVLDEIIKITSPKVL